MKRRKFLIGTGALAAGSAAAVGSGAFTSVSAARTVDVNVAGDDSALLALAPCDGPNGEYATANGADPGGDNSDALDEIGSDYQFELNIPNLNPNAFTRIDNVFEVTNQGTQPVVVYIQEDGANTVAADIGVKEDELTGTSLPTEDDGPSGNGIDGPDVYDVSDPGSPGYGNLGIKIDEGESVKLGVYVDTSDTNVNDGVNESPDRDSLGAGEEIWDRLEIFADANAAEDGDFEFIEANSN
ncbi:hypothetical protein [Halorientalis marina]|uniref:hypothetical protein n=1 Tax=Halorientalis marina TaxID=2931976 RepID=UPI001FF5B44B|nr:hypothetical protein [Halorientalis marina]